MCSYDPAPRPLPDTRFLDLLHPMFHYICCYLLIFDNGWKRSIRTFSIVLPLSQKHVVLPCLHNITEQFCLWSRALHFLTAHQSYLHSLILPTPLHSPHVRKPVSLHVEQGYFFSESHETRKKTPKISKSIFIIFPSCSETDIIKKCASLALPEKTA